MSYPARLRITLEFKMKYLFMALMITCLAAVFGFTLAGAFHLAVGRGLQVEWSLLGLVCFALIGAWASIGVVDTKSA